LLNHESNKKENLTNTLIFGSLVCFVTLSLGVISYKLYYYETALSGAFIIIAILS
jgi:hypothetical protein